MKNLRLRIGIVTASILFSFYLLIPTLLKWNWGIQVPRVTKAGDAWYLSLLPAETLKLGLDLQGGLHLVLGIDFDEVLRDAMSKTRKQLEEASASKDELKGVKWETNTANEIVASYDGEAQSKAVDTLITRDFFTVVSSVEQTSKHARFQLTSEHRQQVYDRALDQSLETLRNRIDEFGISEPTIQRQGAEKILVQFPGVQDPTRIKEIIARAAKLSFQIVRSAPEMNGSSPTTAELEALRQEFEKKTGNKIDPLKPVSAYVRELNKFAEAKLPKGTELLFHKETNVNTGEAIYLPYVLVRDAMVTGDELQDAFATYESDNNKPIVSFELTVNGAQKFEKGTGENVGKLMAIVLDGNVHSAPVIQSKIPGGRAKIEFNQRGNIQRAYEDAKDTALVLRSGSLPARLIFLEERVIGPSLGQDAIAAGTKSLALGVVLVFGFLFLYYRASGVVASMALLFNGLIVLACMSAFEGTLTLPGLAGLTLSLGMAVDANVLIFEHMREELRAGKSFNHAIAEGYSRAFSAIFDGNLTTIIAGMVLLSFGYGPIRGFAVTMLIGLAASMYTAVFVTRVFFDRVVISTGRKSFSL